MANSMLLGAMKTHTLITLKVGYCKLQNITAHLQPTGYNAGVYGWNCSLYAISTEVSIITGYRPTGNTEPSKDLLEELQTLNIDDYEGDYTDRRIKLCKDVERIITNHLEEANNG